MFRSLGAEARVVTEVKVDAPLQGSIVLEGGPSSAADLILRVLLPWPIRYRWPRCG